MMSSLPKKNIQISQPSIGMEEFNALLGPIETGWLTQGPKVRAFEGAFAERHSVKHALATTSCTTALHLALLAVGVGVGDEVIVPAFTWVATANAVVYCGAKPVFVDVREDTYNLDFTQLKSVMTARTKAIIPVHLFGLCADIDEIKASVPEHVALIEDAACAAGASYKGEAAGSLGRVGCFSFHPRKSITTGEGGMLTTNDGDLASRADVLRNHGASLSEELRHQGSQPYLLPDFDVLGFNYRMTDLQGAIGLVQLGRLSEFLSERAIWASWYENALADIPWLILPKAPVNYGHGWQAYVSVVNEELAPLPRNEIMRKLQDQGVSTRPGTHAITELGYYKNLLGLRRGQFSVASRLEKASLALPLHNCMSEEDYAYVSDVLHRI